MVVLVFLGVRSSEFFKHTSFCATELVFFLFIYIAWSRTVWVTVISSSCYFISVQFIPYLTTVFNFAFVVFPPRAMKVNVINKWLLYRGIEVSTAVLGRSHIAVGNATRGMNQTGEINRQVQKSDRINSDRQSGSDQLGSTRIDSDRLGSSRIMKKEPQN